MILTHDFDLTSYKNKVEKLHDQFYGKNGFYKLASSMNIESIKAIANKIRNNSEIFIIIGAGGSYLGAKAAIEALESNFNKKIETYFIGHNLSTKYLKGLIDYIEDKDVSVNLISKSGTTLEPSLAFHFIEDMMKRKYTTDELKERIYITTDNNSLLKELANKNNYTSFPIPSNVGGRYSVLSAVGLLPMAVAGIDIDEILKGAIDGEKEYSDKDIKNNIAYQYAAIRNNLYLNNKKIEILANYEPSLEYLGKWWQQLFGESEGKEGKGIFPVYANFTTDLHSIGQYIQEGERHLFETVINIENDDEELIVGNVEGLEYLSGKTLSYINIKAFEGVLEAHKSAEVPNIVISIPKMDEYYLGKLMYFFQIACAMSSHLLNVNPFDQPGVEAYKQNMFRLLKE